MRGREVTEERWTADERERKERKMKEVIVTEIENEGWFDGKLPLQSV